ncbi:MAG: ParB/RepB/Spo0J family partition protein [Bacteroidetes bacterium]|nr:ParB/RepB/Spo0J family partition protein [Bacteroidota bacterium]
MLGKLQMLKLNPANIVIVEGFNPRIDKGDLSELMASIKTHGVKQPITVRKVANHYELIDGERRVLATLKLGLKSIPAIEERGSMTEEDVIALALVHNDGKPLAPVEEAEAFRRLIKSGWSAKRISVQTGKRIALVKNRLALISAHPDVVAAVKSGKLSLSMGTQIAKKARGKKQKQKRMVKKASRSKEGKKTVALQMGKASLKVMFEKQVSGLLSRLNKLIVIVNKKRAKKDRLPLALVAQAERFSKHKDREVRAAFIAGGVHAIVSGLGSANTKKGRGGKRGTARAKSGKSPKRA